MSENKAAAATEDEVILKVEGLKKDFDDKHVLNGIDLTVKRGDIICVIGPSGSGKSTFLRCLNCMEDPTAGHIMFDGEDLADMSVDINVHRQNMGMVFQHFNLFNNKTVIQNIMLAPVHTGKKAFRKLKEKSGYSSVAEIKEKAKKEAMELLKRIGLQDKADVYPSTLSGGQKQRVAIVRALAMKPKVILFDEPTSALDPEMVGEVLDLMRDVAKEGMTMIIVTHEMGFAREVANRVLFIDEGKVLESAEPAEFFGNPKHPRLKDFLSKVL